MTKFEEEFNYLIELSGKVLIGQVDAEAFEKNRVAFFEKYETDQQQALPVVPECVDMTIKQIKNDQLSLYGALNAILSDVTTEIYAWISKGNQNAFALAFITGKYQVEKPQLFYLKSKSLLENEGESEEPDVDELYLNAKGNLVIYKGDAKKFTQAEIDSMETRLYEKIEVAE